jgi:hypothetical protein
MSGFAKKSILTKRLKKTLQRRLRKYDILIYFLAVPLLLARLEDEEGPHLWLGVGGLLGRGRLPPLGVRLGGLVVVLVVGPGKGHALFVEDLFRGRPREPHDRGEPEHGVPVLVKPPGGALWVLWAFRRGNRSLICGGGGGGCCCNSPLLPGLLYRIAVPVALSRGKFVDGLTGMPRVEIIQICEHLGMNFQFFE